MCRSRGGGGVEVWEPLSASLAHLKGRFCLIFSVNSPEGGRPCLRSLLPCPRIHIKDRCRNGDGSYGLWRVLCCPNFIIIYLFENLLGLAPFVCLLRAAPPSHWDLPEGQRGVHIIESVRLSYNLVADWSTCPLTCLKVAKRDKL